MRFEMELERMKQMHQKELEDKEEELEDVHKSSQRRVGRLNKHKYLRNRLNKKSKSYISNKGFPLLNMGSVQEPS